MAKKRSNKRTKVEASSEPNKVENVKHAVQEDEDEDDDDDVEHVGNGDEEKNDDDYEEALSSEEEEEEEGGEEEEGAEEENDAIPTQSISAVEQQHIQEQQEVEETANAINDPPIIKSTGRYQNKQRCLILSSRGITARYRHLLEDLKMLIPHHKKESKLDVGKNYQGGGTGGGYGAAVNEIAEVRGCQTALFLETRKRGQDGYLWIGRTSHSNNDHAALLRAAGDASEEDDLARSNKLSLMMTGGPSVKFHITNIHTMDELKLTGNCMKGSRPILSFDKSFDEREELQLIKNLFVDVFGTPRGHPKSKPFVDRVMGFYYGDGKIWVRNYQILEQTATTAKEAAVQKKLTGQAHSTSLIEIGPRFVLDPIRIFRGSFGGQTLFVNEDFVNPNVARSQEKKVKGERYVRRKGAERKRKVREREIKENVPVDPLADVFQ
mmetsp:Transcript_30746/g.61090  ORF Transcript_30746/g.61090 Transcript_30746/m.61090 type:complete len:437 (+) Transcript_30746:37-1347(+)